MKKLFIALAAFALLFACKPENNEDNTGELEESVCPEGAVDLGIVMTRENGNRFKLYWAQSNLCEIGLCETPEDYGDYYAWGETEAKLDYTWPAYKWCDGSFDYLIKYSTGNLDGTVYDNKTELETGPDGDDAAAKILGGKWRMPTDAEWKELKAKCKWTWTTQNGVNGVLITSKKNDNSIFLPAAGYRNETYLASDGNYGAYWSSSLYTEHPRSACCVTFEAAYVQEGYEGRCCGLSVRPVSE